MASRANMNPCESQTALPCWSSCGGRHHRAVDRRVARGEDEEQRHQRHRQEGRRRRREPDDHPRPLGVGDLLHRHERHAAAGETGEVEPVHVEELPGAVAPVRPPAPGGTESARGAAQPPPTPEEQLVLAGDRALDEALVERGAHRGLSPVDPVALGPGGIPTAAPAGSGPSGDWPCSFRTWFTIAQRSLGR